MPKRKIRVFLYDVSIKEALEKLLIGAVTKDGDTNNYRNFLKNNPSPDLDPKKIGKRVEITIKVKEVPSPLGIQSTEDVNKEDYIVSIDNILKYAPCPHRSYNGNVENKEVYARCIDCGEVFVKENHWQAVKAHEDFVRDLKTLKAVNTLLKGR